MSAPIFIHGWGFNHIIWQGVVDALGISKKGIIDLGFLGSGSTTFQDTEDDNQAPRVYICHSLGVLWRLQQMITPTEGTAKRLPPIKALISVNGFSNFMNFTDAAVLAQMEAGLMKNPEGQLGHFWRSVGAKGWIKDPVFHVERLREGLSWLKNWERGQDLAASTIPLYAIAARKDRIVPEAATKTEWPEHILKAPIIWHETAPHALPLTEPAWLAAHLRQLMAVIEAL